MWEGEGIPTPMVNVVNSLKGMLCKIWYHLYNLKNVENTNGGVLFLKACNFTKSNTPQWVFFTFFKLHKWYQIVQSVSTILFRFWTFFFGGVRDYMAGIEIMRLKSLRLKRTVLATSFYDWISFFMKHKALPYSI